MRDVNSLSIIYIVRLPSVNNLWCFYHMELTFFYVVKSVKFFMIFDFLTYKGLSPIPDFTLEYSYALVCFIENIFF